MTHFGGPAYGYFSATSAQPRDHWGFAWAPRNTTGISNADFAAQTEANFDRLFRKAARAAKAA